MPLIIYIKSILYNMDYSDKMDFSISQKNIDDLFGFLGFIFDKSDIYIIAIFNSCVLDNSNILLIFRYVYFE